MQKYELDLGNQEIEVLSHALNNLEATQYDPTGSAPSEMSWKTISAIDEIRFQLRLKQDGEGKAHS